MAGAVDAEKMAANIEEITASAKKLAVSAPRSIAEIMRESINKLDLEFVYDVSMLTPEPPEVSPFLTTCTKDS